MLFGDVIAVALTALAVLLSFQGLWLLTAALWPARTRAAGDRVAGSMLSCFLTGLLLTAVLIVGVRVLSRAGSGGQVAAVALAFLFVIYASIGLSGLATLIGRRLASPADADRPWKATVRGGTVLGMTYLFPLLGQVGLLPLSLVIGAGATTLGFLGKRSAGPPAPARGPHEGVADDARELDAVGADR